MADLARHLKAKGITLADPTKGTDIVTATPEKQVEFLTAAPETPTMPPKKAAAKSPAPATAVANLNDAMAKVNVSGPIQALTGTLGYPLLSGRWETFNHETNTSEGFVLARVLIDSKTDMDDINLSWVDKKTIVIRRKWPPFMQKSLFMTGLDVDGTNERFPEGHQVYVDMGKNANALTQADGKIYSEGIFKFQKDMDTSPNFIQKKIFHVSGTAILQLMFKEEVKETNLFGSPTAGVVTTGAIRFGTSIAPRLLPPPPPLALPPLPPSPTPQPIPAAPAGTLDVTMAQADVSGAKRSGIGETIARGLQEIAKRTKR